MKSSIWKDVLLALKISVKNIVSEIIIIDTGSTDKTKEIASNFTNLIFDYEWDNDFSKARNFSIDKATKEWILVLDADEELKTQDINIFNTLLSRDFQKNPVFLVKINNYDDKKM